MRRDTRGTLLLTVSGAAAQALGFFYRAALTRLIGAENMGLYQLILPVYAVVQSLAYVGLTVTVSRLTAEYCALGQPRMVRTVLGQALLLFVRVFAVLALLTAVLSDPLSAWVLGDARTRAGLLLLLPCLFLTGVENLHKHAFYGTGQVRVPALVEMGEQLIRVTAVLGLLVLFRPRGGESTVALIVAGMLVCEVFSSAMMFMLGRRQLRGDCSLRRDNGLQRRMARVAAPIALTSLLGSLMGSVNAVVIPQQLVRSGWEAGEAMAAFGVLFGMALPMMLLPMCFVGALSLILVPRLSEARLTGGAARVRRMVRRGVTLAAAVLTVSLGVLLLAGPGLGTALFHERSIASYLPLLAVGALLEGLHAVLSSMLNGLSRERMCAACGLTSDAVELAVTFLLTASLGLDAYLLGFCLSGLVGVFWAGLCLHREVNGKACRCTAAG